MGLKKGDPEAWKRYWCDEKTKLVNFIGKDNIPFHAIFFPAMTMGQDEPYKTVDELPANEFYNLEGKQFSKSAGWYIDLDDFFKTFQLIRSAMLLQRMLLKPKIASFHGKTFKCAAIVNC